MPDGLFKDCRKLISVTLGELNRLGACTFAGCESLQSLKLTGAVLTIPEYAFLNCFSLTEVSLPDTFTVIGKGAFKGCASLVSLRLPNTLEVISDEAFMECKALRDFTYENSLNNLTTIGAYSFYGCENLINVNLGTATSLGISAFENCLKLENVSLPSGITAIQAATFRGCVSLSSVIISAPVTLIGDNAFEACAKLKTLPLTDTLISVGKYAFKGCESITEATLGSLITVVPEGVFEGCHSLKTVKWHDNVVRISFRSFADCKKLELNSFPLSCTTIEEEAFKGCQSLRVLTVGKGILSIGKEAFGYCTSLAEIVYSSTSERWKAICDKNAFEGCTSLKNVTIDTTLYGDLCESLAPNAAQGSYWTWRCDLAFNQNRPVASITFKENDLFYHNFVSVVGDTVTVSGDYIWKLTVHGTTEKAGIVSTFSTVVTVSLIEAYDYVTYGTIILDLGEGIAAQTDLTLLDLNLEIYSSAEESRLLYVASLGTLEIPATLS